MTLEPIAPQEAVEMYLASREGELAANTHDTHRKRLSHLVRWCEKKDVGNLNELSGRDLHEYRIWRRDDGDLNAVSLRTQLSTLRVFLKFLQSIDGVQPELHDKVIMPDVSKEERARDVKLEPENAFDSLDYLRKYEYAEPRHVAFELAWHTGMRTGALLGLDVPDFNETEAYLEVRHRPEYDTPLKNKGGGERLVGLSSELCGLLRDYIAEKRPAVTDENERQPLLATEYGRVSRSQFRRWIYDVTDPSVSPHAVRRGAITYHLLREWPEGDVSGRMDVSPEVLRRHYDRRTNLERLEQRRANLSKL